MGLQPFNPTQYEMDYIPQRLRGLEICVLACYAVLSGKANSSALSIDFGTSRISEPDLRIFVDLAIDAGLIANRTLLNFMGIKLDNNSLVNASQGLTLMKYGLPLTPVADAIEILAPAVPGAALRVILIEMLSTASKSIAHFTEKGATISVARLGFAGYATSLLVRKWFYQARMATEPLSMIPSHVAPQYGGVWDAVPPSGERER